MTHPDHLFLYVAAPETAAEFYHRLFGAPIVASSPQFALVVLSGFKLGLWARDDVKPTPTPGVAGFEIGVVTPTRGAVEAAVAEALSLGCRVIQQPLDLPFGYNALVATPDGHNLRVYYPAR